MEPNKFGEKKSLWCINSFKNTYKHPIIIIIIIIISQWKKKERAKLLNQDKLIAWIIGWIC